MTSSRNHSISNTELTALKKLRKSLIGDAGQVKVRRRSPDRVEMRRQVDEALLAFRVARQAAGEAMAENASWLRTVRQAVGMPVDTMAQRLGVGKYEIFRLEKAERESRIVLATLRKAAAALGCEVVYALAPREGSLEDLAALERAEREREREEANRLQEERVHAIEKKIGWREAMRRMIRREFRKKGIRVR